MRVEPTFETLQKFLENPCLCCNVSLDKLTEEYSNFRLTTAGLTSSVQLVIDRPPSDTFMGLTGDTISTWQKPSDQAIVFTPFRYVTK